MSRNACNNENNKSNKGSPRPNFIHVIQSFDCKVYFINKRSIYLSILCQKKKVGKIDNLAKFPQTPISHIQCIRVQKSDEFDDNGKFDEILRELKVRINQLLK